MILLTLVAAATVVGEAGSPAVLLGEDDGERFSAGRFNGRSLGLSEGPSVTCLVGSSTQFLEVGVVAAASVALPWWRWRQSQ